MTGGITTRRSSKAIAFLLAIVLALALLPVFGATTAEAAPPYTDSWANHFDIGWYDAGDPDLEIGTAAELAGLAALVNGITDYGEVDFDGKNIRLTASIDLDGYWWVPIGGVGTPIQGVPNAPAFSGIFDGTESGFSITNMNIDPSTLDDGDAGFGLFGYVDGGSIANVSVSGAIDVGTAYKAISTAVGGVAGYLYGNISNCHSAVAIHLPAASNVSSGLGGIAGVVENTTDSTPDFTTGLGVYIQNCSSSGDIYGGTRAGGIAGAVYATTDGAVVVRQSYNTGDIATDGDAKVYCGGVIGYSRGYQSQLGNTGSVTSTANGHYVSGLVALLQGAAPEAQLVNSFSVGQITYMSGYSQQLYSDVDNSRTMVLTDLFWSKDNEPPSQENAPGTGWGVPTDVLGLNADQIANTQTIPLSTGADVLLVDVLNEPQDKIFKPGTATVPAADGVLLTPPEMNFPSYIEPTPIGPVNPPTDTDDPVTGVFLDGTAAVSGDGTQESPFNNFADAKAALAVPGTVKDKIYITNTVTLTGAASDTWTLSGSISPEPKVVRSSTFDGYLIFVDQGYSLQLTHITIDGNWMNPSGGASNAGRSLIAVNGLDNTTWKPGMLILDSGTLLTNNFAGSGGLIRIEGGIVTQNGGSSLTNSKSMANAGAVAVYTTTTSGAIPGTFTLNDGEISGNTAGNGGAIYAQNNSDVTIKGGEISGNTATNDGGAIYDQSTDVDILGGTISGNEAGNDGGAIFIASGDGSTTAGGSTTIQGGTISENTAAGDGNGIYVAAATTSAAIDGNLILDPFSGSSDFDVQDVIYLPTGTFITLDSALYIIQSNINVQFENTQAGTTDIAAIASDSDIADDSVGNFASVNPGSFSVSGANINFTHS